MSIATIGGLITSTLLTLVVIPVAYLLLDRAVQKIRSLRSAPLPPAWRAAARVTGVLIGLGLVGAFVGVAHAFAGAASDRGRGDAETRSVNHTDSASRRLGGHHASVEAALTIERALQLAFRTQRGLEGRAGAAA